MKKIPVSLIIDDGSPVNMFYFHNPGTPHEFIVPPAFTREFAKCVAKNGIKGKFSVVPNPGCLGSLDKKVNRVPAVNIKKFLDLVRTELQGPFSITPEILTHYRAINLETGNAMHVFEDVYISKLCKEEIADYVAHALEILSNCGLHPTGVTSPWNTGIDNEKNYYEGIGRAFVKQLGRKKCFYFLHSNDEKWTLPTVMVDTAETGRVVHIPNNAKDPFWDTQNPATARQAVASARRQIDSLISPDGKKGKLIELADAGLPLIFISHWQSIFSDGRKIGLEGLNALAERINKHFGNALEWMNFEELAEMAK